MNVYLENVVRSKLLYERAQELADHCEFASCILSGRVYDEDQYKFNKARSEHLKCEYQSYMQVFIEKYCQNRSIDLVGLEEKIRKEFEEND